VLGVARDDVARAGERSNLAQHGARELQDIGAGRVGDRDVRLVEGHLAEVMEQRGELEVLELTG